MFIITSFGQTYIFLFYLLPLRPSPLKSMRYLHFTLKGQNEFFLLFSLLCRSLEEYVNDDESGSLEEYFMDSLQKPYWTNMCFALWASAIRSYLTRSATFCINITP